MRIQSPHVGFRGHLRDPLFRGTYFMMLGYGAAAVSSFVFWIIAARIADAHAIGSAAGLVSAVTLLSYLTSIGLPYGILRYAPRSSRILAMATGALIATSATSVVAAVLFSLISGVVTPDLHPFLDSGVDIVAFAAFNVAASIAVLLDGLFAARRQAPYSFVRNLAVGLMKPATLGILSTTAFGIYAASFIPIVFAGAITWMLLPRILSRSESSDTDENASFRGLMTFSLKNYPSSLIGGAPQFLLPLLVLSVTSATQTAYFYVSWGVVTTLTIFPAVVSNLVLAEGVRSDSGRLTVRALKFALCFLVPLIVALNAAARPLLELYGTDYYQHGLTSFRILTLSVIPWTFMVICSATLRFHHRNRDVLIGTSMLALSSLGAAIPLGLAAGLVGVSIGWTIGVLLSAGFFCAAATALHTGTSPTHR